MVVIILVHGGGAVRPGAVRSRSAPCPSTSRRRHTLAHLAAFVGELIKQTNVIVVSEMAFLLETLLDELLKSSLLLFEGVRERVGPSTTDRCCVVKLRVRRVDTIIVHKRQRSLLLRLVQVLELIVPSGPLSSHTQLTFILGRLTI